jgi:hypothetical protein
MTKKMALVYTFSMVTGLMIGAFFNPVASIVGGFLGLYVIANLTGKMNPDDFKSCSVERDCDSQDVAEGNVGLGCKYK